MNPGNFLFGIILLLAGRKFFWVFVGIVGFVMGMEYAAPFFQEPAPWLGLLMSLAIGIVGAVVAIFAQWAVITMAGFAGGGYLLVLIARYFSAAPEVFWGVFFTGGLIGAVVMIFAFDFALIFLSSFLGAALIVTSLGIGGGLIPAAAFFILSVTGICVQSMLLSSEDKTEKKSPKSGDG